MARRRASMREGPLAELFRATEAAQHAEDVNEPAPTPLAATNALIVSSPSDGGVSIRM